MDTCPVCASPATGWCKCEEGNRWCAARHHWKPCPEHRDTPVVLPDDATHGPSKGCLCGRQAAATTPPSTVNSNSSSIDNDDDDDDDTNGLRACLQQARRTVKKARHINKRMRHATRQLEDTVAALQELLADERPAKRARMVDTDTEH